VLFSGSWSLLGVAVTGSHSGPSICSGAALPPTGGNAADSASPARRSGRSRRRRWCAPVGRCRFRYASGGTRCAMGEGGARASHSTGTGWHSAQPDLRSQYRSGQTYIRSKRVPCFSIATMTDSSADCCVWLDERAAAAVGRSVCRRLVWFTVSCVRSCVA